MGKGENPATHEYIGDEDFKFSDRFDLAFCLPGLKSVLGVLSDGLKGLVLQVCGKKKMGSERTLLLTLGERLKEGQNPDGAENLIV